MKKLSIILLFTLSYHSFAQNAKIRIDIDRPVSDIDPKIYGVFMEPIHFTGRRLGLPDTVHFNTLYGNLYDPASPLANEDGFRKDYIDAMKELKITNMRWPGGNFLMGYNWQDGIGRWIPGRRMNGDQDHQGRHVRIPANEYSIQHVKLYTY